MQIARWTAAALFILAVPLLLVLTAVRVAAVEPRVYEYSFSQYDAVQRTGIDRAQLDYAARDIVHYFRSDAEFLTTRVVIDDEEQPLFTPREVLHMRDVKALFGWAFLVQEVALVYVVGYVAAVFLWSRERHLRHLARQTMIGGLLTVAVLGVAALGVVIEFDALFRQFHLLSFSNDLWQLDPSRDHLIQMFPQGFWFDVTLGVGLVSALLGGLLATSAYAYLAWDRRRLRASYALRTERLAAEGYAATQAAPVEETSLPPWEAASSPVAPRPPDAALPTLAPTEETLPAAEAAEAAEAGEDEAIGPHATEPPAASPPEALVLPETGAEAEPGEPTGSDDGDAEPDDSEPSPTTNER